MYVDSTTLAALTDEFAATLVGGRVQDLVVAGERSFGLEIYAGGARHNLLISADPKAARAQVVEGRIRRGVELPSTLALLMRKYVEGARLVQVSQPPWERILCFDFSGGEGEVRLIAELMDQRSNLILTVAGEILDSLRRVGGEGRARVILPRKPYVPPPPQVKSLPHEVTESALAAILRETPDAPAWRALVGRIAGVSPLLGREIVFRAGEDADAPAFDLSVDILFQVYHTLIDELLARRWQPCVVPSKDGVRAFAAYPLTCLGPSQPAATMSAALTAYYAAPARTDPYKSGKRTVGRQVEGAAGRVTRKLAALEREAAKAVEIETLRQQGELIMAYASTIRPRQTELVEQYEPDSPPLAIPLNPSLSAVQNARAYFERYEKAKRAAADVPALIRAARQEASYLEQLATDLDLAESWPEIDAVREELQRAGYWQGPAHRGPQSGKPGIRRLVTEDGFVILVGRNAEQNHRLVTEKSKPDDLWLHARDVPGSHVLIRFDGRPIPEAVALLAARLAAYFSAARGEASVEVVIAERRHVRPLKGGRPGQVTVRRERVVAVRPEKQAR